MKRFSQRPTLEILEDRQLLSTCHVVRLGDFGAGADLGGGHSRGDLRYCITKTDNEAGADSILLERTGTINLTGPLPNLADDVLIAGLGSEQVTVRRDTGGNYRVFSVDVNVTAQLFGMTIANGVANGSGLSGSGGGIANFGTLVLLGDVVVTQNQAVMGGGIYTDGDLTVYFSTISENHASSNGGALYAGAGTISVHHSMISNNESRFSGGGIYNEAILVLSEVKVTGNTLEATDSGTVTVSGGGIRNIGSISISYSTISGNVAQAHTANTSGGKAVATGGGVSSIGTLTIENSTIAYNTASATTPPYDSPYAVAKGGGIEIGSGDSTIINSTIALNTAYSVDDAMGGGIYLDLGGWLSLEHSTVADNEIPDFYGWGGGLCALGSMQMHHSIIALNDVNWEGNDVYGDLGSLGYNIINDTSFGSGYAPTDLIGVDVSVGSLQVQRRPHANNGHNPRQPRHRRW